MVKSKDYDIEKDYGNGKIYMEKNKITGEIYIGSTTATLKRRDREHKHASSTVNTKGHTKFIKKIMEYGKENFEISLIEDYPCDNVKQLHKREGYWQVMYNSVRKGYNTAYAYLPEFVTDLRDRKWKANWYQENKERTREKHAISSKKWRENNIEKYKEIQSKCNKAYREGPKKEELLQKKKEYYLNNLEKIKIKEKEFREKNQEKLNQKKKDYYQKNKERLNEVIECECGGTYSNRSKSRHVKTKLHTDFVENK